jgi:hypothetical protein
MKAVRNGASSFVPADQSGGYGNLLGIKHIAFNGGYTSSWYAHLSIPTQFSQPWDAAFAQGDWIGALGTTGATGCHLHFQVDLGFGSPLDGAQTTDVVLSGTPYLDGFDLQQFSDQSATAFASNNTGPGYGRPGAPATMDPGPPNAPLRPIMRNYVRNLAVYTIDYGSTKASSRGACGANRRWVKKCGFGYWGDGWVQGFIANGLFGQIPRMLVEGPSSNAFSVDGQYWKAYGRVCGLNGTTQPAYVWLGRPTGEDFPLTTNIDTQLFQGGALNKDYSNPQNVRMTVYVDGVGSCVESNVLDINNDPCYDVNPDSAINSGDQGAMAPHVHSSEGASLYDDRYDLNHDGVINSGDQGLLAVQVAQHLHCT